MRALSLPLAALLCLGGWACSTPEATSPVRAAAVAPSAERSAIPGDPFVVMTQNVGPGVDLDPLLAAQDPNAIPALAFAAWMQLRASDPVGRAGAVARLIAAYRPALVGLQEVALFRRQHPSDAIAGGTTPATDTAYDALRYMLDTLRWRGAEYRVVSVVPETDVEVPMFTGGPPNAPTFDDVRFTDRDVILARRDVPLANVRAALYSARIPLPLGGPNAFLVRGWASVDATVGGGTVRFFSTHLEDQHSPAVQLAQAEELVKRIHDSPHPVVLVGDLNSAANEYAPARSKTPTYAFLTGAGKLTDAWPHASHPTPFSLTCCHPDALNEIDWPRYFDQRLDLVLLGNARGSAAPSPSSHERWNDWETAGLPAAVVGLGLMERSSSGLWPSDHAGVVATLRLAPGAKR